MFQFSLNSQIWPSILNSLNRTESAVTSVVVLAGLMVRQILRLSTDFISSRYDTAGRCLMLVKCALGRVNAQIRI